MNAKYDELTHQCRTCINLQSHPRMDGKYKTWNYYCTKFPLLKGCTCPYFQKGENMLDEYELVDTDKQP